MNAQKPYLLIVDDSDVICNKIQRDVSNQLNQRLQVVGQARNGVDALNLFKKFRPKYITMDLVMPQMDGLECIRQIMNIDPSVNILVVSALSDEYTGLLAISYGARGFIRKPFQDGQIPEALKMMLANP